MFTSAGALVTTRNLHRYTKSRARCEPLRSVPLRSSSPYYNETRSKAQVNHKVNRILTI
jgi:hypothetical protein